MDPRFPDWYRAVAIQPEDEFLRKRWDSIHEFTPALSQAQALELVRLFHGMRPSDTSFAASFEAIIQKHDAAFTAAGRPKEFRLLAGAALAHLLKEVSDIADAAALATVIYHCHGIGSKGAVPQIVQINRAYLNTRSEQQRSGRTEATLASDPINVDARLTKAEGAGAHPEVAKELSGAVKPVVTRLNQLVTAVADLKKQQDFFREESNVLWWVMGEHSRDFNVSFASLPKQCVCVIAGKELADLAASAVGPYAAQAFLDRVLPPVSGNSPKSIQISAAVNCADLKWAKGWSAGTFSHDASDFCPITLAFREAVNANGKHWTATYKGISPVAASAKLTRTELAHQVYEEALLLKLLGRPGGGA